jgi:hypothetical protein
MTRILKIAFVSAMFLAFTLPCLVQAQAAALGEKDKIEALIRVVSQMKTAKFVRNGWSYTADTAAYFLRKKWEANDSAIKTARDFIDKIGSISGTSGKPYLVKMKDGTEMNSREFLLGELKKLELPISEARLGGS